MDVIADLRVALTDGGTDRSDERRDGYGGNNGGICESRSEPNGIQQHAPPPVVLSFCWYDLTVLLPTDRTRKQLNYQARQLCGRPHLCELRDFSGPFAYPPKH